MTSALLLPFVVTVGVGLVGVQGKSREEVANRWGFYPSFPARFSEAVSAPMPDGSSSWPVSTNAEGFRDDEWPIPAEDGVPRVLLVGDSFVFGYGIAEPAGLLDRCLERALSAEDGGRRWDVWNLAQLPSAIWYYVNVLLAVAPEVRPRAMVISFVMGDLDPFELQRTKRSLTPWLIAVMEQTGVFMEMDATHKQLSMAADRQEELFALHGPEVARLVRYAEAQGIPLVVWSPYCRTPGQDAQRGLFGPFAESPVVSLVDWCDGIDLARSRGVAVPDDWQKDPSLVFVGDGHPLARANELFALAIAHRILAFEAAAGRSSAPPPPRTDGGP